MTKNTILSKTIAAAASLVLCVTAASAATLVNGTNGAGELFIGFRATGGTGATTNIVLDLGSAAGFSALATGSTVSLGNIGSDLATAFGSTWFNRTDVLWSAVSGNTATDINTNTLYGGRSATGLFPLNTTGYARQANNAQGSVVTGILSAAAGAGGFTTSTTGSLSNVAIEDTTSNVNSWTARAGVSFSSSALAASGFEQAFAAGTLASGAEGALDIYRMVKTGTTDPDTAATTGLGSYQMTVTVDSSGNLTGEVLPLAAVPEPASLGSLFSAALLGIGALRRKRGAKA